MYHNVIHLRIIFLLFLKKRHIPHQPMMLREKNEGAYHHDEPLRIAEQTARKTLIIQCHMTRLREDTTSSPAVQVFRQEKTFCKVYSLWFIVNFRAPRWREKDELKILIFVLDILRIFNT